MLFRSSSFTPPTVLTRISIPSPSGYCGAMRSTRQSGSTKPALMSSAATATRMRAVLGTGDSRGETETRTECRGWPGGGRRDRRAPRPVPLLLLLGSACRGGCGALRPLGRDAAQRDTAARHGDAHVPLHLLMQRRTEVGAVHRIDAGLARDPLERAGLARHDEQLAILGAPDGEAVRHIPVLLEVGEGGEH